MLQCKVSKIAQAFNWKSDVKFSHYTVFTGGYQKEITELLAIKTPIYWI